MGGLPDGIRHRLERSFGTDLSGIRLHRCGTARRITEDLGTTACAVDGAILVGVEVSDRVLAHEVVHILQARLPGSAPVAAAEAEAHRLGARALAGLPCRVTVPADGARPLCWEEAGHYYTVYFTALARNLPDDDAARIAFWAQLPDEVSDLDAVKAGLQLATSPVEEHIVAPIRSAAESVVLYLNNGIADIYGYGHVSRPVREPPRDLVVNLDVQRGLHCLTGRPWETETGRRLAISSGAANRSDGFFEFGISLHAYGDSYAHRDHNGRMYMPIVGHAAETLQSKVTGDVVLIRHPDGLTPSRAGDYTTYIMGMHNMFAACFPQYRPRITAAATAEMLSRVIAWHPEPSHQITQIRALAAGSDGLNRPMNSYRPETNEDVYYDRFFYPTPYAVTRGHINDGLRLARRWAG